MKKAMKAALCILSAVTMVSAGAVNAAAGTLSKEELIGKYAPNGAYETHIQFAPCTPLTYYDAAGDALDLVGMAQADVDELAAKLQNGELTKEELEQQAMSNLQKILEQAHTANAKAMLFNDYRRGYGNEQWFVNAEYENGFYYVLREDGTASIVGAEQADFAGKTVIEIPAEIGGVTVTEIEKRAFEQAHSFFADVNEIILPDTVEIIGEGAFSMALIGRNCRINLPENLKYIGRCAFYHTAQWLGDEFNVIKLPESVEFIGLRAFSIPSGRTADINDPSYRIGGFQSNMDCILDMPESLVMLEDDCVDADAVREANGSGLSDLLKSITYAEINTRSAEDAAAIDMAWWNARKTYLLGGTYDPERYREMLLNSGAPLTELDIQLVNQENATIIGRFYNQNNCVCSAEDVLAFCEKYDMTQQRVYQQYMFGYSEYCTFLYDEGNYIDMSDVAAYYGQSDPRPADVAVLSGDVDNNGTIDVSDAVLLARFCAEEQTVTMTAAGRANADVNSDGLVTNEDVVAIEKIIAKL